MYKLVVSQRAMCHSLVCGGPVCEKVNMTCFLFHLLRMSKLLGTYNVLQIVNAFPGPKL